MLKKKSSGAVPEDRIYIMRMNVGCESSAGFIFFLSWEFGVYC